MSNTNSSHPEAPHSLDLLREKRLDGTTIRLIDTPTDWGKPKAGAAGGPEHLRKYGIEKIFQNAGAKTKNEVIDVPRKAEDSVRPENPEGHVHDADKVVPAALKGRKAVQEAMQNGEKILSLRGDHSGALDLAGALLAAGEDPEHPGFSTLKIIWIDSHADINGKDSPSMNAHGMVVKTLLGLAEAHPELAPIMEGVPKLRPANVTYVGLNQPDNQEVETLNTLGVKCYTFIDLETKKPEMYERIRSEANSGAPVWLECDTDSVDSSVGDFSDMSTDVGLTRRELHTIAHIAENGGNVAGVGIAEFVPEKDPKGIGARVAISFASRALGAGDPLYNHGGYNPEERAEVEADARAITDTIQDLEARMTARLATVEDRVEKNDRSIRRMRAGVWGLAASVVLGAIGLASFNTPKDKANDKVEAKKPVDLSSLTARKTGLRIAADAKLEKGNFAGPFDFELSLGKNASSIFSEVISRYPKKFQEICDLTRANLYGTHSKYLPYFRDQYLMEMCSNLWEAEKRKVTSFGEIETIIKTAFRAGFDSAEGKTKPEEGYEIFMTVYEEFKRNHPIS